MHTGCVEVRSTCRAWNTRLSPAKDVHPERSHSADLPVFPVEFHPGQAFAAKNLQRISEQRKTEKERCNNKQEPLCPLSDNRILCIRKRVAEYFFQDPFKSPLLKFNKFRLWRNYHLLSRSRGRQSCQVWLTPLWQPPLRDQWESGSLWIVFPHIGVENSPEPKFQTAHYWPFC